MNANYLVKFAIFSLFGIIFASGIYAEADEKNREISSQPDVVSCTYSGVTSENGQSVVTLKFNNLSGKEITNILAGFRIRRKSNNELVYTTGVTYGFPINPGETKYFTLFRWLPMPDKVKKALVDEEENHTITLVVGEITYADGTNTKFE